MWHPNIPDECAKNDQENLLFVHELPLTEIWLDFVSKTYKKLKNITGFQYNMSFIFFLKEHILTSDLFVLKP